MINIVHYFYKVLKFKGNIVNNEPKKHLNLRFLSAEEILNLDPLPPLIKLLEVM